MLTKPTIFLHFRQQSKIDRDRRHVVVVAAVVFVFVVLAAAAEKISDANGQDKKRDSAFLN